jgi:hypothetical protein
VSDSAARREEWARLRAERAALRETFVQSVHALEVRAQDPFGLKEKVRRHPFLAAGLAAGAGAILVNLLMPRRSADAGNGEAARTDAKDDRGSPVFDALRDAALRVAGPWVTRFVADHLGPRAERGEPSETNGSTS